MNGLVGDDGDKCDDEPGMEGTSSWPRRLVVTATVVKW